MTDRAIGIVRVSQRDDDEGHSPEVQVRAMLKFAKDRGWALDPDDIWDENVDDDGRARRVRKVSGSWGLDERPKLRAAVEAVESGTHTVVIAERFDRFFRDLDVQREVIRRVEAAGGRMETIKQGAISHATAEAELQANLNGAIAQYAKRTAKDRSWDAVEVAIEQGKVPWSQTAPGYRRDDGRLRAGPKRQRDVVVKAFEMRADGATVDAVRTYLAKHGIKRSYHGTTHLLRDRIYVGEIHFGAHLPNLNAHEAIVDRDLFERVQRVSVPRGPKPPSDRILARLGVLRCANCGARMVVGTAHHNEYAIYRCPPTGDCERRVTISARVVEEIVVNAVRDAVANVKGRASAAAGVREAEAEATRARANYEAALAALADFTDAAAVSRLRELREVAEATQARVDQLGSSQRATVTISAAKDWDRLSLDARRELIRTVVDRALVSSGRGLDRVTIEYVGQNP